MSLRVATAGSGVARTAHYVLPTGATNPIQTFLVEPQASNLVVQSEDLANAAWTAIGTPTITSAANTAAGVSLDLIGDDDATALEGYSQTITYTGNDVKAFSLFVKEGTSTSSVVRVRQTSGTAANRLLATITWSAGVPVVTMTTGTFIRQTLLTDGVYRLMFQTTTVTATETNVLQLYPATDAALAVANTGTLYVGGVQSGNAAIGTSYIKTTTTALTRNQDVVFWENANLTPKALTFYVRLVNIGTLPANNGGFRQIAQIGGSNGSVADIYFRIGYANNSATLQATYRDGTNLNTSGNVSHTSVVFGDIIEYRAVLLGTAQCYIGASVNGAAEVVSTTSAGSAVLVPAFTQARIYPGASLTARTTPEALTHILVADGEQTMATMRALAGVA